MKKININITKAQILSFRVEIKEATPVVSATIGLFTAGGKNITDYSISTESWNDENKFELPATLITPIVEIMKQLEVIVVKHCNQNQKQLNEGSN